MIIIPLYLLEQLLKMWALGMARYFWEKGNVFDIVITMGLVIVQVVYLAVFGIPYWGETEVRHVSITCQSELRANLHV